MSSLRQNSVKVDLLHSDKNLQQGTCGGLKARKGGHGQNRHRQLPFWREY
tara:strand:+ start:20512 stop:20661 length:150 start_codon:yes stop_codon:yes gene_type:complete